MTQQFVLASTRFWRERPHEVLLAGVLALVGMVTLAGSAWSTPTLSSSATARLNDGPPAPPPLLIQQMAPEQALAVNQAIPVAAGDNPAARPFALGKVGDATYDRALECLTSAIYYEAGQESTDGQRAVAQVVLNRVRHPAFPATVCGVVYEGSTRPTGCQFTFTCDGSLYRGPSRDAWNRARAVAKAALAGYVYKPVGNATHYHADYVVPYWAPTLAKSAVIGAHIFYRWAGGWGRPAAFTQRYANSEPNVASLKEAALAAEQRDRATRPQQAGEATAVAEIPGAEALPLKPSMRGDKRVAIRFNLAARKAAEEAPREEYIEKVAASDNLRWSLSEDFVSADAKPLGKPASPAPASGGGSANAGSPE